MATRYSLATLYSLNRQKKRHSQTESLAAKISNLRIAAAHEGAAEVIVTVDYDGGGSTQVPLDGHAVDAMLKSCGVDSTDELIGQSWQHVRDALSVSYNRFK